jgi:aerobic-type carbon monoxide dehydrogenase small subunit (CoxS/CutS family)
MSSEAGTEHPIATARGEIAFTVNGAERRVPAAWGDEMLLDTLREQLGLVGTKYGCGIAACGACRVHVDGVPVTACRVRTAEVSGRSILTIEGLGAGGLHRLQRAWIEERVPQCGYCQPGQLMQAAALLASNPAPSDDEIRAAMAGNLCRCGTYERIRRAIRRAAREAGVVEATPRG